MDIKTRAIDYHSTSRENKKHYWYAHQERDMPPQMACQFEGSDTLVVIGLAELMASFTKLAGFTPRVDVAIKNAMKLAYAAPEGAPHGELVRGKRPIVAILAVDALQKAADIGSDAADALDALNHVGDLQAEFASDPSSEVEEVLITHLFERSVVNTVDWAYVAQTYTIGDGGVMEWGEEFVISSDEATVGGAVTDAVIASFGIEVDS